MKRFAIVMSSLLAFSVVFAQGVTEKMEEGVYAIKISPNGKWIGSMAGDASIYDVEKGNYVYYDGCFLGIGNVMADNGMAVGDMHDIAAIMYNQKIILPPSLGGNKYWFCDINGITPDATRITGIINNPNRGETYYVPFIAEVDGDGNVSDPVFLPYPKTDFFNMAPQYVSGIWISRDGKTVMGQVQDWRGMYSYPIVFKENAGGEWEYFLPSASMFNPQHIEIPENPWKNEPPYPEVEDFLTGQSKQAYLAAYEAFSVGLGPWPDPYKYFTEEQAVLYELALEAYNEWYYGHEAAMKSYTKIYNQVLMTTPSFNANDAALDPNGNYFLCPGGEEDAEGNPVSRLYRFEATKEGATVISKPQGGYYPTQILPNGTVIITLGLQVGPRSYMLLPGTDEWITLEEYFNKSNPDVAAWIHSQAPNGNGILCVNDDMTVFSGGLYADLWTGYSEDSYIYNTYIITMGTSGVERIAEAPADGVYHVYNLQGVKVAETRDVSDIGALPKGIYLVNGKKFVNK